MAGDTWSRAESYLYRLLNYRPRSEKEIRDKLANKKFPKAVIDSLVMNLKDKSIIDDYKFAMLWTKSRLQTSCYSFFRIRNELKLKGIAQDIIEEIFSQLQGSSNEYEKAKMLVEKRLEAIRGLDPGKARHRLYSYLKRRGFSNSIIYKVIDEARADTE